MALPNGPVKGGAIDVIARGLAGGMSRREALRAGGAAVVGAAAMTPADAWAALTGTCPSGRVSCHGKCCPKGEVCLGTGAKRHCGCPHHETRCSGQCVHLATNFGNCGRCGHACRPGQHCAGGRCVCPVGDTLCAGVCVSLAHNHKNCGACGHACASNQVCSEGHCVVECATGETNCGGSCVNLKTNHQHCGTCGHACGSGELCSNGQCVSNCPSGETDCRGTCVDLDTNTSNCGMCGHVCQPGQFVAQVGCSSGTCVIVSCTSNWANCDGEFSTGCETLTTTTTNCGGCGNVCSQSNATNVTCTNGTCSYTCNQGFGNCDTTPPNTGGCSTSLNTVSNCGACGQPCNPANATGTCATGTCAVEACDAGYFDCNGNPADGCECLGTACCGTGCQTLHSNGVGQNYYDCFAQGTPGNSSTYNATMAMDACQADSAQSGTCTGGWTGGSGGNVLSSVCRTAGNGTTGSCVCWGYSGTGTAAGGAGHVKASASGGCFVPVSSDPTWN